MQTSGSLRLRRLCLCLRLRLRLRRRLRLRLLLFSAQFLFLCLLSVFESVCPRRDATRSHANHVLSLTVSLLSAHSLSFFVYRTLSDAQRAAQELLPQSNAHWACPVTASTSASADLSLVYTCVLALVSMAAAETRKEAAVAAADDERETLNLDSVYRG